MNDTEETFPLYSGLDWYVLHPLKSWLRDTISGTVPTCNKQRVRAKNEVCSPREIGFQLRYALYV